MPLHRQYRSRLYRAISARGHTLTRSPAQRTVEDYQDSFYIRFLFASAGRKGIINMAQSNKKSKSLAYSDINENIIPLHRYPYCENANIHIYHQSRLEATGLGIGVAEDSRLHSDRGREEVTCEQYGAREHVISADWSTSHGLVMIRLRPRY